jgi:ribosomal protein S18 acetylase RimI-like enzyme
MVLDTTDTALRVRDAKEEDRTQLANLIHFEKHIHRHMDWRPPLDWIGFSPYCVVEKKGRINAVLACPPDPPGVAWIRVFGGNSTTKPAIAWDLLWPEVLAQLQGQSGVSVAAIPLDDWFKNLLTANSFAHEQDVVALVWENNGKDSPSAQCDSRIRPMHTEDLPAIQSIDTEAFGPIWRNSLDSIELAFEQAAVATVAENNDGKLYGYQISTTSPFGAHLARLAVHPLAQRQGIGYALVRDLLAHYEAPPLRRVTVNTQSNNQRSLSLYQKAGFRQTEERFPVYQYHLDS